MSTKGKKSKVKRLGNNLNKNGLKQQEQKEIIT